MKKIGGKSCKKIIYEWKTVCVEVLVDFKLQQQTNFPWTIIYFQKSSHERNGAKVIILKNF